MTTPTSPAPRRHPAVPRRPDAAGRAALALYRTASAAVRAHVTIRWWSAPFAPVAAALPARGRILEIGCGHGLFSAYAALGSRARDVVGVDIDADKIAHARDAAARTDAALRFEAAPSGAVPDGPWDAVVFVDMLYLLPAAAQRELLLEAIGTLTPDATIVIKEMGDAPAWKVRWNRLQETVSVRLLRITQGATFDFVPPATTAAWLEAAGFTVEHHRLDRRRVHPHHVIVGRRTA